MKSKHQVLFGFLILNGLALQAFAHKSVAQPGQKRTIYSNQKTTKYLNGIGIFRPFTYFHESDQEETVYTVNEVNEAPTYYGGADAMAQFVSDHLKYPEAALKEEKEGRIWVEAIIDKEGTIKEVRVSRGMGLGCDEEALRIVKSMPRWRPGKVNNMPVRVKVNIPVLFKLP